jgi:hypothetical protein
MRKAGVGRPSPALVISVIALFVALGGSAYAVNKVGTKQLKNNAVTAAKIKRNAVTKAKIRKNAVVGAKIRKNTVTGAKINESSLGTVPRATHAVSATQATNATHATNAVNATNAANFSGYSSTGIRRVGLNQTVELAKEGPFTFYGKCTDAGGGTYEAETYATTSAPNSLISSYTDAEWEDFSFEPGEEAELGEYASDSEPYWSWDEYSYDAEWTAIDPTGTIILYGVAANGVHVLGSPCTFNLAYDHAG